MDKINEIKRWVIDQVLWAEDNLRGKSGAEKKEAVVKKLDDLIVLPIYLEWVDDLVDQACDRLNAMTNKNFMGLNLAYEAKGKIAETLEVKTDE